MFQAFIMVLREGFEAFLIVAIIVAYLRSTQRSALLPAVYSGLVVSVATSVSLGLLLMKGINESLWEGVLGIVTIVMVGTLVIHMWRVGARLKIEIQDRLQKVVSADVRQGPWIGIFLFTVFMVTREGMETALLLLQVRDGGVLGGILLGLLGAGLVAFLWARFGHLVNVKRFFQVTGLFLILFILQVAIYSFHEFSEAGLLPNSEVLHVATEPFSPMGLYGQWFSVVMVSACGVWLLGAWVLDKLQTARRPTQKFQ